MRDISHKQENTREISFIKDNILQYIEYKGITKYKFYEDTGISNGILSQKGGLTESNILKFLSHYKEVNPTWLLTGKGEMILKPAEYEIKELPLSMVADSGGENIERDDLVKRLIDTLEENHKVLISILKEILKKD